MTGPGRFFGVKGHPSRRCGGAARRATVLLAVGPRGRARGLSHAPSKWCHPAAALCRGTHPAVSGLLRAGAVPAHPSNGGPSGP